MPCGHELHYAKISVSTHVSLICPVGVPASVPAAKQASWGTPLPAQPSQASLWLLPCTVALSPPACNAARTDSTTDLLMAPLLCKQK